MTQPLQITQLGTRTQWRRHYDIYEFVLEESGFWKGQRSWEVQRRVYTPDHDHLWQLFVSVFIADRYPDRIELVKQELFPEFFMEQLL